MKSSELLKLIDKQWANRQDVQKIANVGKVYAGEIFTKVYDSLINENWYLPNTRLIPMSKLIEYLNIDIEYLKKMSRKEVKK